MTSHETNEPKKGLFERGLKWDEHFNRRLGVVAVGVAGGAVILGAPVVAGFAAMFAAGNFVAAEVEKRAGQSFEKRRLGEKAIKNTA